MRLASRCAIGCRSIQLATLPVRTTCTHHTMSFASTSRTGFKLGMQISSPGTFLFLVDDSQCNQFSGSLFSVRCKSTGMRGSNRPDNTVHERVIQVSLLYSFIVNLVSCCCKKIYFKDFKLPRTKLKNHVMLTLCIQCFHIKLSELNACRTMRFTFDLCGLHRNFKI